MPALGPKCCLTPDKHQRHIANYYFLREVILDFCSKFVPQGMRRARIQYQHVKKTAPIISSKVLHWASLSYSKGKIDCVQIDIAVEIT